MKVIDNKIDMKDYSLVKALQQSAFPPNEQFSMEEIFDLAKNNNIFYKSFWEDDKLCGIIFYDVGKSLLYLFYLAIDEKLRFQGYGTRILKWLIESYPEHSVVANIEVIGMNSENEDERIKRLRFYEKNGFTKINTRLHDDSGIYDIVTSTGKFDDEEYLKIIDELGFGDYHPAIKNY